MVYKHSTNNIVITEFYLKMKTATLIQYIYSENREENSMAEKQTKLFYAYDEC